MKNNKQFVIVYPHPIKPKELVSIVLERDSVLSLCGTYGANEISVRFYLDSEPDIGSYVSVLSRDVGDIMIFRVA